jgi:hypothetical protein
MNARPGSTDGLYLPALNSLAAVRRLIEFYVTAHNEVTLDSAFHRQTPDEVFFPVGEEVTRKLAYARKAAREKRMKKNRAAGCGVRIRYTKSRALLLQRPRSRMP